MPSSRVRGNVVIIGTHEGTLMSEETDVPLAQLDLRKHMKRTITTAVYPFAGLGDVQALMYVALGLSGEAGEIANQVKKVARDDGGMVSAERRAKVVDELGDVMWYWLRLCYEMSIDPYDVLMHNEAKLTERAANGTVNGDRRGGLMRQAVREWEANLAEAAGKEDVWAVPQEAFSFLITQTTRPGTLPRSSMFVARCRSLRCPTWEASVVTENGLGELHEAAMAHIMAEHTPWGRAGRD